MEKYIDLEWRINALWDADRYCDTLPKTDIEQIKSLGGRRKNQQLVEKIQNHSLSHWDVLYPNFAVQEKRNTHTSRDFDNLHTLYDDLIRKRQQYHKDNSSTGPEKYLNFIRSFKKYTHCDSIENNPSNDTIQSSLSQSQHDTNRPKHSKSDTIRGDTRIKCKKTHWIQYVTVGLGALSLSLLVLLWMTTKKKTF